MPTPDTLRAALLLSNRLTRLEVAPLKAREFWALLDRADARGIELGELLGNPDRCDAVAADDVLAERVRALLDATRAFAFDVERLGESGIELISALDDRFPTLVRDRMGHSCPPHLFAAGDIAALGRPALSIVVEADASGWVYDIARRAVAAAVVADRTVISADPHPGQADAVAGIIDEAVACNSSLVVLAAAGINRVSRQPDLRKLVQDEVVCLASPFAPDAPESAATIRACNSLLHALAEFTLVAGCCDGTGPIWATAFEAVQHEPASVLTVTGPEAPAGNSALVALGAHGLTNLDDLSDLLRTDRTAPHQSTALNGKPP